MQVNSWSMLSNVYWKAITGHKDLQDGNIIKVHQPCVANLIPCFLFGSIKKWITKYENFRAMFNQWAVQSSLTLEQGSWLTCPMFGAERGSMFALVCAEAIMGLLRSVPLKKVAHIWAAWSCTRGQDLACAGSWPYSMLSCCPPTGLPIPCPPLALEPSSLHSPHPPWPLDQLSLTGEDFPLSSISEA